MIELTATEIRNAERFAAKNVVDVCNDILRRELGESANTTYWEARVSANRTHQFHYSTQRVNFHGKPQFVCATYIQRGKVWRRDEKTYIGLNHRSDAKSRAYNRWLSCIMKHSEWNTEAVDRAIARGELQIIAAVSGK
jgi:hypothetical protein